MGQQYSKVVKLTRTQMRLLYELVNDCFMSWHLTSSPLLLRAYGLKIPLYLISFTSIRFTVQTTCWNLWPLSLIDLPRVHIHLSNGRGVNHVGKTWHKLPESFRKTKRTWVNLKTWIDNELKHQWRDLIKQQTSLSSNTYQQIPPCIVLVFLFSSQYS